MTKTPAFMLALLASGSLAHAQKYDLPQATIEITSARSGPHIQLNLEVDLKDGWKTYHKSVEGYDTELKLLLPSAEATYEIAWPPFQVIEFYGDWIRAYGGEVTLPIDVYDPSATDSEPYKIDVEIFFCSQVCTRELLPFTL